MEDRRRGVFTRYYVTCLVLLGLTASFANAKLVGTETDYSYEKDPQYWHNVAHSELENSMKERPMGVAKNVILFLGDGMGIQTVTAARILGGQMQRRKGEEVLLSFDTFPYTGLSRTYSVNYQVVDSAASGTAYLTGVKANQGTLGVNANVLKGKCNNVEGNEVESIVRWAIKAGKSTGIVTTTRITHATPAAAYSHSPHRDWEVDRKVDASESACKDIAAQLIDNNKDINVIMGGGRNFFLPANFSDPAVSSKDNNNRRLDGRNLIEEWQDAMRNTGKKFKYVYDRDGLEGVDTTHTDYLLGLFAGSHLEYEQLRNKTKEPSLAEMTAKAIQILRKNKNGFFLLVEGGRIDHAHHDSKPSLALHDTVAFADAVDRGTQLTSESDTLITVTADHSHTMAFSGYPTRGNDILGKSFEDGKIKLTERDGMPYTTILYANGPGHQSPRQNITTVDTLDPNYVSQSAVPMKWETHGGEDVAIYSKGPQSFLYSGVHEQNYIPMVMAYASCIGPYGDESSKKCARDTQTVQPLNIHDRNSASAILLSSIALISCTLLHMFG